MPVGGLQAGQQVADLNRFWQGSRTRRGHRGICCRCGCFMRSARQIVSLWAAPWQTSMISSIRNPRSDPIPDEFHPKESTVAYSERMPFKASFVLP